MIHLDTINLDIVDWSASISRGLASPRQLFFDAQRLL